MGILRILKENATFNAVFRSVLKGSSKLSVNIHSFLIKRWSPSGILECTFGSYKFKYYNKCDDGLPSYFYYDLPYQEKADLNLFIELSKKSHTIVDIGANTGLFSVLASIANPGAIIHSIEPYSINAERMRVNLKLNAVKNVTVHEIAIADKDGEIAISIPQDNTISDVSSANSSFSKAVYPTIKWVEKIVKSQTLDTFEKKNNIKIDLIKCDVETFEMSVFKGAGSILEKDRPTIIFECFLDDERKLFFSEILSKYNYYAYLILEQGVVYSGEGFVNVGFGLNYLITPVKPSQTFIGYADTTSLCEKLLNNVTV